MTSVHSTVRSLLRDRNNAISGRVTMVELFFDLVFVFAVTQLSHMLLHGSSARSAFEVALLLTAIWWAWVYTSWVTNWLEPDRIPVRAALFAWMLAGLLMSAAIPDAFGERGLLFAGAYVSLQVGRTLFFLWAVRHERLALRRNFQRILVWLGTAGIFWLVGAMAEPEQRMAWWCTALLIEIASPGAYFWVPGLGRSSASDWDIDGGHMSERCALFVIIALGESLLATGATFSQGDLTVANVSGFASGFVGTVAMWWLYFHRGAEQGHHRIANSNVPGQQGMVAYTYLHLPIVAGIIVVAVADILVMADGTPHTWAAEAIVIGGPLLYLAGTGAFNWASSSQRRPPVAHLVGVIGLAGVAGLALVCEIPLLALHVATTVVLVIVGAWEEIVIASGTAQELPDQQKASHDTNT